MRYSDTDRNGIPFAKDPCVVKFRGIYWMFYSIPSSADGTKGWGIGIAQSHDLYSWKKSGELNPSTAYPIEKKGICAPCAIVRNDTLHLFYQTYGNGTSDAICHATSTDAIHFCRDAGNPVFHPSGQWNCGRAIDAEVHLFNGKYFLYYATRDKAFKRQLIGVATTSAKSSFSRGTWKEACAHAILSPQLPWEGNCIEAPSVITRNKRLYMFYAGNYNNSPQQIGLAESTDGIKWTRCDSVPFLRNGKAGEWNSSESGHPGIFDNGDSTYLFYQGNNDNGHTWYLSNRSICWNKRGPILASVPSTPYLHIDMVHSNPGEPLYESAFNQPEMLKRMGYNAKCFFLFDSPTLAINWDAFDKDILPPGTPDREWVDRKAARLHTLYNECKRESLQVYAMSDLILLPKRLVAKYHIEQRFGNPLDTLTQRILRYQIRQIFLQFPQMDGLVVRIGETYLQDAPFHTGSIQNKTDADKCIIPLMQLLRDEICVGLNKKLIFRTWWAFDTQKEKYEYVTSHVKPHPNLIIAVKHCEGDFHRGNPFSKVLGLGQHQQLVEVQCAREYEGKGAYPNYIAHGVIEGFDEHEPLARQGKIWNLRQLWQTGLMAGLWTWSRGGGWEGPYIKDEIWCQMNAWVLNQWACNPSESEESIFYRYCSQVLHLDTLGSRMLRHIAMLSEEATLLGLRSKAFPSDVPAMWLRDEYLTLPPLPADRQKTSVILKEKDQAVGLWDEIAATAQQIQMTDTLKAEAVRVTCEYGRQMYRLFRDLFYLSAIKNKLSDADKTFYLSEYDDAWACLSRLSTTHPMTCPTLYQRNLVRRSLSKIPADVEVDKMR